MDKPGVFGQIAAVLGRYDISIASVIQQGRKEPVFIYMVTHQALEKNLQSALHVIDQLPITADKTTLIRIEDPSNFA